jgi:branched-subunit amino acid transport protein
MSDGAMTVLLLASGCWILKATGPVLLGGRPLPMWLGQLAARLPAPLLAALTVVAAIAGENRTLVADARLIGCLAAAVALWRRANFAVVVLVAAIATAAARTGAERFL